MRWHLAVSGGAGDLTRCGVLSADHLVQVRVSRDIGLEAAAQALQKGLARIRLKEHISLAGRAALEKKHVTLAIAVPGCSR